MSTQEKHTLPGLDVGVWIAWTDNDGQACYDEVRSWSEKKITCILGAVRWDAPNLRIIPPPTTPQPDATSHQPRDGETRSLPLRRIAPSPLNPRKTFHRDTLEGLAESIRDTGLIQSLVVRPTEDWQVVPCRRSGVDGWSVQHLGFPSGHWDIQEEYGPHWFRTREEAEAHRPQWELIAGERRFRASVLAGKVEVECKLRIGLDDAAAYRMMIDENEEREPVNPIDEALSLHVMLVRGVSQRRLAEVLGNKSQTKISRMAALVELPESVKQLGRERKLQASHLERIARWAKWPAVCAAIGELAGERNTPVRELEGGLPFGDELRSRKLVRRCCSNETAFAYTEVMAQPEHKGSFVKGQYGYVYCLDVALYDVLQREGKKNQKARQAAEVAKQLKQAGIAGEPDLPRLCDLRHGTYEHLEERYQSTPSCDGKSCPCVGRAWDTYNKRLVQLCMDPERRRELRAADKAAAQERARVETQDFVDQVHAQLEESQEISARDLIFIGNFGRVSNVKTAAELLRLDVTIPDRLTAEDLSGLSVVQIRNLFVLAKSLYEQEERIRWADAEKRLEWYLGIEQPEPPAPTAEATGEDWPCQSCGELVPAETVAALNEALGERPYLANAEGVIFTAKAGIYCAECATDARICRVCGCTEELGCDEGCAWEDDDTCTACAQKLRRAPGEVTLACYDCGTGLDPRDGLLSVTRAGRLAHVCEGCKGEELAVAGGVA